MCEQKEWFYEAEGTLTIPNCSELAELITQCMNYDPSKRPFFRAIVRELDRIKEQSEPRLFHKAFTPSSHVVL